MKSVFLFLPSPWKSGSQDNGGAFCTVHMRMKNGADEGDPLK